LWQSFFVWSVWKLVWGEGVMSRCLNQTRGLKTWTVRVETPTPRQFAHCVCSTVIRAMNIVFAWHINSILMILWYDQNSIDSIVDTWCTSDPLAACHTVLNAVLLCWVLVLVLDLYLSTIFGYWYLYWYLDCWYWYWYWYLWESTCCQDKVIFCCNWHIWHQYSETLSVWTTGFYVQVSLFDTIWRIGIS